MRTRTGFIGCVAVGLVCLFAAAFAAPAGAITGGTDDDPTNPRHPEVGLVVFYQPDGRFRCSGTLIDPQVVLTAGHCTFGDVGKVIVTFDTQVAQSIEQGRLVVPRALDDPGTGLEGSGYDDGLWVVETDAEGTPLICGPEDVVQRGCTEGDVLRHEYDNSGWDDGTADGAPVYHLGTAIAHPDYSDFTDIRNWNDTGVVVLDEPIAGIAPAPLAPEGYLDSLTQPQLVKTLIHTVGYGTEVRQADTGPQVPTPQSYPLRRQYTDEKGQKLTPQILSSTATSTTRSAAAAPASVTRVVPASSTAMSSATPATGTRRTAATSAATSGWTSLSCTPGWRTAWPTWRAPARRRARVIRRSLPWRRCV